MKRDAGLEQWFSEWNQDVRRHVDPKSPTVTAVHIPFPESLRSFLDLRSKSRRREPEVLPNANDPNVRENVVYIPTRYVLSCLLPRPVFSNDFSKNQTRRRRTLFRRTEFFLFFFSMFCSIVLKTSLK